MLAECLQSAENGELFDSRKLKRVYHQLLGLDFRSINGPMSRRSQEFSSLDG